MISSGARSTVKRSWKKSLRLDRAPALRPLDVDLRVDRQHRGGVVGRRIGVREAAAERAAIAHLRIADLAGGLGDHRALLAQQRRRGDVVMRRCRRRSRSCRPSRGCRRGPGSARCRSARFGSLSRSFISGTRLWPPAMQLAVAVGRLQLRQRIVERRGALVVECGRESLRWPPLNDAPQLFGPQHHVDVLHAELAQRVDRRGDDARASSRACRLRRRPSRRAD